MMKTGPFIIREARADDAPAIKSCVEAAYGKYVDRIGGPPGPMLDDYSDIILRHQAFVAEENGEIVGVLVLMKQDGGMLLDNVAVHPSRQGQGLGALLMARAEAEAISQGFDYLDLYTHEAMFENVELYLRSGYFETERRREKGYNRIYMRKHLP